MHLNTTQTQEVGGWKPVRKEKKEKTKIDLCCLEQARKNIGTTQEEQVLTFWSGRFWDIIFTQAKVINILSGGFYCTAVSHYDCTFVLWLLWRAEQPRLSLSIFSLNSQNREKWAMEFTLIYEVLQHASSTDLSIPFHENTSTWATLPNWLASCAPPTWNRWEVITSCTRQTLSEVSWQKANHWI